MDGSGLQQIIETIYAPNTVPSIMAGKAIARALRAHFIVSAALYYILHIDVILMVFYLFKLTRMDLKEIFLNVVNRKRMQT